MNSKNLKFLVVGSGFFGSTIAERIASDRNEKVAVLEKRGHIGGNCFSAVSPESGIEFHRYGSHIFHTSNEKVWKYINRFTGFNSYQHKVLAQFKNRIYQMPINLNTINSFFNLNLKSFEAESFLRNQIRKEKIKNPVNLEEKAISLVGRPLYEALIKGYTIKQWEEDPKDLPAQIITRLPVRFNYNSNYFDDPWQGLPIEGYTNIFKEMLNHKNIAVYLKTDFFKIKHLIPKDCCVIYTGPIDRFFNYKYGKLGWRTLVFESETINKNDYQGTAVMNYADESISYIRIHEFKHLHPERKYKRKKTLIFKEFSKKTKLDEEPYYPINTCKDEEILNWYLEEAKKIPNIIFGGRLGTYRYLDMDKTIACALETYEEKIR